jgi:CTP synthase
MLLNVHCRVGRGNMSLVHVSLVPVLGSVGEQKTKPTQHGVRELRSVGLHPDVICCRSTDMLEESTRRKISIFCQVPVSS